MTVSKVQRWRKGNEQLKMSVKQELEKDSYEAMKSLGEFASCLRWALIIVLLVASVQLLSKMSAAAGAALSNYQRSASSDCLVWI